MFLPQSLFCVLVITGGVSATCFLSLFPYPFDKFTSEEYVSSPRAYVRGL